MIRSVMRQEAAILVIFGGIGDLSKRKLAPAIFNLMKDEWLPEKFALIAVSYHDEDTTSFKKIIKESLASHSRSSVSEEEWEKFSEYLHYFKADFNEKAAYTKLIDFLEDFDTEWKINSIKNYYLSVSPGFIEKIAVNLAEAGATRQKHLLRIVIEKPFGRNLNSAHELNELLARYYTEKQIYRIDHYLGKETVQNILAFRFGNSIFEPIWNKNYIDNIQITVAEQVGVEHRGNYYDKSGALRDMMQNHLLQLLCMIAMEPPVTYDPDEVRNRKVDVLNALRKYESSEVDQFAVRGQYSHGVVDGEEVLGYRKSPKVGPESNTETFAAIKVKVDNWRWKGVPFYLRTGKSMPEKTSSIAIEFKPVSHEIFPCENGERNQPNILMVNIQPEEGVKLSFQAKRPGLEMNLDAVEMTFKYKETYQQAQHEAYETLLLDIMEGDPTLFMRSDEIEAAWEWIMPILSHWEKESPAFPNYAAGTWGPEEAENLLKDEGRSWLIEKFM